MKLKILFLSLLFSSIGYLQPKNPDLILENVKKEFDKIEDYKVDVKIKVDVDFLKMSDRKATIYYKKPNKFHIDSDNFALLPKSGLNSSPLGFLDYKYNAYYMREDTVNGRITSVIRVIPLEGDADVILTTLWVDTARNLILKVESTRKPQGTFYIEMDYQKTNKGFWLPSSMKFSFTVERGLFPGRSNKEKNTIDTSKAEDRTVEPRTGYVYLKYSNYEVNIGLSDSIFEEKDENK